MEEQRPGQVVNPKSQLPQTSDQPTTPDEIAQIDTAMEQAPRPEVPSTEDVPESLPPQGSQLPESPASTFSEEIEKAAADSDPVLTWQAAEPRSPSGVNTSQIIGIGVAVVVILVGLTFLTGGFGLSSFFSVLVVIMAIAALVVSSRRPGHLEMYALYEDGVSIGDHYYSYNELRAFAITPHGDTASIELEPVQRFMLRLTLHLEPTTAESAVELLAQQLPHNEHSPDLIDRLSRRLRL